MNKYLILLILMLPFQVSSKTAAQKINDAYNASQLEYDTFLESRVLAAFDPARLPAEFQSTSSQPMKCGTGLMTEIKLNWTRLSQETQRLLKPYLGRPILSESYVSPSGLFRIHYDKTGSNAVDPMDENANGLPDFVEEAGRALDYSYHLLIDSLRYTPPPLDGDVEGPEYDLYFYPMGMYGYTQPEKELSKVPPRYTSYTVIHNSFGTGFYTHGLDAVRVTCAHEFFHMVQMGYALRDGDRYYLEMSSTWIEDVAFDDVNDYYAYLPYFFENTSQPFNAYNGYHEYGTAVWNFMLEKKYGQDLIRSIWEYTAQYPTLEAMDYALIQVGSSFDKELESFSIWNYFTGSRQNAIDYYPEGANYPELKSRESYSFQNDVSLSDSIQRFGCAYYDFSDAENSRDFMLVLQHLEPAKENSFVNFDLDILSFPLSTAESELDEQLYVYFDADEINRWRGNAIVQYDDGTQKIRSFSEVTTPEVEPLRLFPNPFFSGEGESFRIQFKLAQREWVEIKILSMNGNIVKNVTVPGRIPGMLAPGFHPEAEWDGTDEAGIFVGSGIYLVCLKADSFVKFEKISVIRK